LRNTFNNFLLDGLDNNANGTSNQGFSAQVLQPPPDAIAEFRVATNNQSAEYGRAAGATVNVVLRSGTNQINADAWEFFRNDALNAEPYFLPPDGKKPPLTRNQFGGVLGGPIVKNRAFFFADYEGFRQTRKSTIFSTIPTAAQAAGILAIDIRDPRTGTIYPAGTPIPMTSFARSVLSALPAPSLPGAANNYSIAQSLTNDSDKVGGKMDVQISPSLSIFGRYGWRDLDTFDQPPIPLPSGGGGNGAIYVRNRALGLGATWVAGRNSLLEIRWAGPPPRPARTRRPSARRRFRCRGSRAIRASPGACCRRTSTATRRAPARRCSAARRPTRSGSVRPSGTRRSTTRGCSDAIR
jgi:hypothetical protein